ncbi:hypothetical protein FE634_06560 [Nocardioides dongxiaopingii]|uniref:hypothetical protein n=1 Tax=Nocardioides TaxID=1839 RepID=UPI0010C76E7C|nr:MULTISPECIES: hypothetical protein [Nocardioides]QCW50154.1 hypothetical protein FE634_06560 [Nocardioides sp. S-1144]
MSDDTTTRVVPTDEPTGFLAEGRHPVSISHLVMGVAFAGMTLVWALLAGDVVEGDDVRWLMPVPWVLAGVAGLVGLVVADRRRVASRRTGWVDSGTMEP